MRNVHRLVLAGVLASFFAVAPGGAAEEDRIAELMELRTGMHVADVGAGNGRWSEALARLVGESGHVYANEIDEGDLERIRERIEESDLRNMTAVEGRIDDTMLPEACCDAMLLRHVYHDITHREEMRASIIRSLRPGGRLLVIEVDTDDHGIPEDELISDMTSDGFHVVSRHPRWQDSDYRYAVLFGRSP
jgi:ubiquinone/menaquinone biosynthesis C-methylase UbiE